MSHFSAMKTLLVAFTIAGSLLGSLSASEPVTVFKRGQAGYQVFRIPAIIKAANGDLIALCEARQGGDASEIDMVSRRSTDSGKTWGELQVVLESDDFQQLYPGKEITIGNPAPVVDLLDKKHPGRIWLPFTIENDRVCVTYSDDHGSSWARYRDITNVAKLDRWGWYATGPVHSIQLQSTEHRGRLVIPCDHRLGDDGQDKGANGAHVLLSDDHGATWRLGAIDDSYEDGLNANETTVVELADGHLYFSTRDQHGKARGTRGFALSPDGGDTFQSSGVDGFGAFAPTSPTLDTPVVQSSLLRASLPSDSTPGLILFCGPDENGPTGKGRSDLRIRYTTNEARSWHDGPLLHVGPAAYSDMVSISDDSTGVLFEAGPSGGSPYDTIQFLSVQNAALTAK
ncbi:MAG: hypothetical protein Aurels2KO_33870 [Aureliella sp.]